MGRGAMLFLGTDSCCSRTVPLAASLQLCSYSIMSSLSQTGASVALQGARELVGVTLTPAPRGSAGTASGGRGTRHRATVWAGQTAGGLLWILSHIIFNCPNVL